MKNNGFVKKYSQPQSIVKSNLLIASDSAYPSMVFTSLAATKIFGPDVFNEDG